MKLLEKRKIAFEIKTYPTSERDAEKIAVVFGVPPEQVYKTLVVVRGRGKPLLVMVAADRQLDLKKLAKSVGEKKLKMATHKEAEQLTKLQVGGISPLVLLNKGFDICADKLIQEQKDVFVSAGQRGINLKVGVSDLLKVTRAKVVEAT